MKIPNIVAENFWKCDESEFSTDRSKSKVIAPCNKPGLKVSYGPKYSRMDQVKFVEDSL